MAPHSFPAFALLLPAVLVLVAFAAISARASVATIMTSPAPAVEGSGFLHACCANTTNASTCYDSLLPHAGSFHGNRVLVARAAAILAFTRLRSFREWLRRLPPGATGGGRIVDRALQLCVSSAEVSLLREGDALAVIQRLETAAGRGRGEQAESDLNTANLYVGGIGPCVTSCVDDVESIGDAGRAALASPVGKKVLAWVANVRLHGDIALDLVVQSEPEYVVQSEPE
jgi:pectinesterase